MASALSPLPVNISNVPPGDREPELNSYFSLKTKYSGEEWYVFRRAPPCSDIFRLYTTRHIAKF